jgi:hypothetical protein
MIISRYSRLRSVLMKRSGVLVSLIIICLPALAAQLSPANTSAGDGARELRVCPFDIVGLWRSDETTASNPVFFNFSREGWVSLLKHADETLPQDLEIITAVSYKLDKPTSPLQIEFVTARGNDAFPPGITLLDIIEYGEDNFTTRVPTSGQQTHWFREQTHRYFLALAARWAILQSGGPAFATLTTLDGRQPQIEALGVQITTDAAGKPLPSFGAVPAEVYERIPERTEEENISTRAIPRPKDETAIMRFELTPAEFEKVRKVFDAWSKNAKIHNLPTSDPYLNAMELFRKAIEPLNKCGKKLRLEKQNELSIKDDPHRQPIEFIKGIKKRNQDLHVKDSFFPWGWRPMLQLSGQ